VGKDDPRPAMLRIEAERAEIRLGDASIVDGVKILLGADPRKVYEGNVASVPMDR
jgi:hypothetical protein